MATVKKLKKAQDGKQVASKKPYPHNESGLNKENDMRDMAEAGGLGGKALAAKKAALAKAKTPKAKCGKTIKKAKDGTSFPDLNKDGKITKADILKGRGVIAKKGAKIAKKAMPCASCGKKMKKK